MKTAKAISKPAPKKPGRKPNEKPAKPERDTSPKKRCAAYVNVDHIKLIEAEFGNIYRGIRTLIERYAKSQEKKVKA